MASQYQHAAQAKAGQTTNIFSIPGPGRLRNLLLSANPYAAYTITDTASQSGPWLSWPYPTPGSAGFAPAGSIQPALLVTLFASTKPLTYGPGLPANAVINFNTSDWAGSVTTDASGNIVTENFYLNPPQGWYFAGYLQVSMTGIAANLITVVSASILVEVF